MAFQLDIYHPTKDLVTHVRKTYRGNKEQNRKLLRHENIASLGPAINSDNWTFRFVEESGQSLDLLQDDQFAGNSEYASNTLNFDKSLCLPREDGNPSLVSAKDVYASAKRSLSVLDDMLHKSARRIFDELRLGKRDLQAVREEFQNSGTATRLKSLSDIRERYPALPPRRYNRKRWEFKDSAKLGTITNWLGNRVALTDTDETRLFRELGIGKFNMSKRKGPFSEEQKQFIYELMLIVLHAFDTVEYLSTTMKANEVIDLQAITNVFHDNGELPEDMRGIEGRVNYFSYTVLLPLFFTKQLYLHRSEMLIKLRKKLIEFRKEQSQVLTGDDRRDLINIRMPKTEFTERARNAASIVCISDLLDENEENMSHTYGEFPQHRKEDICHLPKEDSSVVRFPRFDCEVDHLFMNIGTRKHRNKLDKTLKSFAKLMIKARGDRLETNPLARQVVVYVSDPTWESDIIGGVDQLLKGVCHSSRHKLLTYLALIGLVCNCSEEKGDTQDYYLRQSYSQDSEFLKKEFMNFLEDKVTELRREEAKVKLSDIQYWARKTTKNRTDQAVIVREMVHSLIDGKTKLVPDVSMDETDGCYFNILYGSRKYGEGKLVVDGTISLGGLSTTEGNCSQLYTTDGRVLTASTNLRKKESEIVHLEERGNLADQDSYPVIVASDLRVG